MPEGIFLCLCPDLASINDLDKDGNTKLARFDTSNCRIFVFFNLSENKQRVEHFEIRDQQGELIKTKEKIQHCYKNFGLA